MADRLDFRYWGFFVLGLLSLLLLLGALQQWWAQRLQTRSRQRLPALSAQPGPMVPASGQRLPGLPLPSGASPAGTRLLKWLAGLPGAESYSRLLQQTGWPLSLGQAMAASLALAIGGLLLTWSLRLPLLGCVLAALGSVLALQGSLVWQRNRRAALLELQLPDALSLVARSMQAGHAFSSALQIAAQESPSPMGQELRGVFHEIQYGESPNEALSHWAARVAGQDVRIFVIAVRIQSETGGNLAELLHQTAALIRERQKLRGVVRVLSAEGRISAVVLTLLPFGLGALLTTLNHAFMAQLWTTPIGQRLLGMALLQMGVGVLWMWRLVRVQP